MSEITILVTGFGSFPGAPHNPTARLVESLEVSGAKARLARFGIKLELSILPVVYSEIEPRLKRLIADTRPDAILHFGLAARRKALNIETRAANRLNPLRPDSSGASAGRLMIRPGSAEELISTFPAEQIDAAFRRAGISSRISIDAGDYVCNETLYLSLAMNCARSIGFIHVPKPARLQRERQTERGATPNWRPKHSTLTRAALIAIFVTARNLRGSSAIHLPS
jgi:pyroglutamyl-peptidase